MAHQTLRRRPVVLALAALLHATLAGCDQSELSGASAIARPYEFEESLSLTGELLRYTQDLPTAAAYASGKLDKLSSQYDAARAMFADSYGAGVGISRNTNELLECNRDFDKVSGFLHARPSGDQLHAVAALVTHLERCRQSGTIWADHGDIAALGDDTVRMTAASLLALGFVLTAVGEPSGLSLAKQGRDLLLAANSSRQN